MTDITQKEYIIVLKNFDDLDSFYSDMESQGSSINSIPDRALICTTRRPMSRGTQYMLTKEECQRISSDLRVESITIHPRYVGAKIGIINSLKEQTSSHFNKSTSVDSNMINYGLLRSYEGHARVGWGSDNITNETGTIKLAQTGKNVDVVIVDEGGADPTTPEYAVNADGTGDSRMIQQDWYQYSQEVLGYQISDYPFVYTPAAHSTHVSGTVAGNTQGWARSANIYNIPYDCGGGADLDVDTAVSHVIDFVRAFHNHKSVNPDTGRKNPTITNHSWGISVSPFEYIDRTHGYRSLITAVNYRGKKYYPIRDQVNSDPLYYGTFGIYSADAKLANLIGSGPKNIPVDSGNRIVTTGSAPPSNSGTILSYPPSWTLSDISADAYHAYTTSYRSKASLTGIDSPITVTNSTYVVTVQGPCTVNVKNRSSASVSTGSITIDDQIVITDDNINIITTYTDSETGKNGEVANIKIDHEIDLTNPVIYTITFNQSYSIQEGSSGSIIMYNFAVLDKPKNMIDVSVTGITNNIIGRASLTQKTNYDVDGGNLIAGYWKLDIPFTIKYLGIEYTSIYVGTYNYITFGAGYTRPLWSRGDTYVGQDYDPDIPFLPKIFVNNDGSTINGVYYGIEGTAPNRTFRLRIENNYASGNSGAAFEYEVVFYENHNNQIDIQLGANTNTTWQTPYPQFNDYELAEFGFINFHSIPYRIPLIEADIKDAMADGIIFVGSAGNSSWYHDVPGGLDWDNSFEMANVYPDTVDYPIYYHRGQTPTANDENYPFICVGALDKTTTERKAYFSDTGPGVDIWASGYDIISSLVDPTSQGYTLAPDPRNSSYNFGKLSGTSMSSPQVTGVLACALEVYPDMNQVEAKEYITKTAKLDQIESTGGGYADQFDLNGSPNLFLYYKRERELEGNAFPKVTYRLRPDTGSVYPRNRTKRRK
jgi:subtilisin family serine protease